MHTALLTLNKYSIKKNIYMRSPPHGSNVCTSTFYAACTNNSGCFSFAKVPSEFLYDKFETHVGICIISICLLVIT